MPQTLDVLFQDTVMGQITFETGKEPVITGQNTQTLNSIYQAKRLQLPSDEVLTADKFIAMLTGHWWARTSE